MKNKNIYVLSIIFFLVSGLFANDMEYTGGYAGSFLRMGLGARNQALGNVGVALNNSSADFYYNPALIALNKKKSVTTGYSFLSLDRKFNFLGITLPLPPTAAVSINWIHAGTDEIQGRSFSGYPDEIYSTGEDAVMIAFGNKLSEKLAIGISLKYLHHSLLEISGNGMGFDFGIFYQAMENLSIGAQYKDLNSSYNWKTTEIFEQEGGNYLEKFPTVLKFGAVYGLNDFLFVVDIVNFEGKNYYHGGMEYNYQNLGILRIGYDHNSFTFGCGLIYDFMWKTKTQLDYAFVQEKYGEGHSHVFTWNFKI